MTPAAERGGSDRGHAGPARLAAEQGQWCSNPALPGSLPPTPCRQGAPQVPGAALQAISAAQPQAACTLQPPEANRFCPQPFALQPSGVDIPATELTLWLAQNLLSVQEPQPASFCKRESPFSAPGFVPLALFLPKYYCEVKPSLLPLCPESHLPIRGLSPESLAICHPLIHPIGILTHQLHGQHWGSVQTRQAESRLCRVYSATGKTLVPVSQHRAFLCT